MATLYISEFGNAMSVIGTALAPVLPQPAITDQAISISSSSATSAAFNAQTRAVLLVTDTTCNIVFGAASSVAATSSNLLLPANTPMIFGVPPGYYVAAIT